MKYSFRFEPLQLVGWFVVVLASYAWMPGPGNDATGNSRSGNGFASASVYSPVVLQSGKLDTVLGEAH